MASQLQVQYAFLNASASGNTTAIAAQAGQRILVLQAIVISGAAGSVKFATSTGPTDISATWPVAANGGFVIPYSQLGWFQTNIGDALLFNQSGATSTGVHLVWCPMNS